MGNTSLTFTTKSTRLSRYLPGFVGLFKHQLKLRVADAWFTCLRVALKILCTYFGVCFVGYTNIFQTHACTYCKTYKTCNNSLCNKSMQPGIAVPGHRQWYTSERCRSRNNPLGSDNLPLERPDNTIYVGSGLTWMFWLLTAYHTPTIPSDFTSRSRNYQKHHSYH